MKLLRETTEWEGNIPNHDYMLNDAGHMVAYRKQGQGEWLYPNKPSKLFSRSRRSFITLKEDIPNAEA